VNIPHSIRLDCTTETCPNYQMVRADDPIPAQPWRCSTCLDAIERQMVDELARREDARRAMLWRDVEDTF
jgi:hypothetical protein